MLSTTGGKLKVSPKKIIENYKKIKRMNGKKKSSYRIWNNNKTISS